MTALETALAGLVPQADRLDRERLMFLAGRASALGARQSRWAWPAAFAAMAAVAASLLVAVVIEPRPQAVRMIPAQPHSETAEADRHPATSPERAEPIQPGPEDQHPDAPPWPSDLSILARADRRLDRILVAESSRAGGGEIPGTAQAPVPYRELLESLLKDAALEKKL